MKLTHNLLQITAFTLVLLSSQHALSAGYLKIGDIKGESTETSSAPNQTTSTERKITSANDGTRKGGLDRDIIRRHTPSASGTQNAPATNAVKATKATAVEPEEID
ncbi:hypothetical protein [Gilvimarinus sp. 1_MG-2023]|uniref:hypothetical protein n=1 Tax=Gilvimarinus sp. 1_MG-2023 TaxID=3062638 RepID=UPI0026E24273|nr:hypothetical protein [Gilvimarinus sp. 1_MG-2023]MDO6748630.1 hypothetical protein [Gilvimarinus sp. 1_MG-2023]